MPRKLRVYGWTAAFYLPPDHEMLKDPRVRPWHRQQRAIVAATSQKEAARIAGADRPSQLFNLSETGNDIELSVALAEPGVIFVGEATGARKYYRLK